jgi:hypothetical protein
MKRGLFSGLFLTLTLPVFAEPAASSGAATPAGTPLPAIDIVPAAEHSGLTPILARVIPQLRDEMMKAARQKDPASTFAEPTIRSEAVTKIGAFLGMTDAAAVAKLGDCYNRLRTEIPTDLVALATIRRVYIYDGDTLKRRLAAGEQVRYFSYDPATKQGNLTWSIEQAKALGDAPDVPIFVVVPPDTTDYEAFASKVVEKYRAMIGSVIGTRYSVGGLQFLRSVTHRFIRDQAPAAPHWFVEGLANVIAMRVLGDFIGTRNAIEAFNMIAPATGRSALPTELESWNAEAKDPVRHAINTRTATTALMLGVERGRPKWMAAAFPEIAKAKTLSSQDIYALAKQHGNVELKQLMQP